MVLNTATLILLLISINIKTDEKLNAQSNWYNGIIHRSVND